MNDIEKNNRLIAVFMGYENYQNTGTWMAKDSSYRFVLSYDKNWSELMPVVDKIESLQGKDGRGWVNYVVSMDSTYCVISLGGEGIIADYQGETRIECTYEAVLKFIEYWNRPI